MWLFIISWMLCGLSASLILTAYDLRGNEYNQNYFDHDFWVLFLVITLLGYTNIVIVAVAMFKEKVLDKIELERIIYKIANIGLNKNDSEDMKHITNAERLSNLLMDGEIDSVSDELWNEIKLNDDMQDYHQLRDWMKDKSE